MRKSLTFRILAACALLVVGVLALNQGVYALSPEQKKLFDLGVYQFDIETGEEQCGLQSSPISLSGNSNAAKAFNFLVGQGLTDYQAAGVVGNLQAESSIMPNRKQGSGMQTITSIDEVVPNVGFGIAQWTTAGRQTAWKNFAKQENMDPLSLELQLLYLWHELETNAGYGLEHLTSAKDLAQATWIFLAFFERPATVIDAGKAADPVQPTSGGAYETLNTRIALAKKATGGGGASSTTTSVGSSTKTCDEESVSGATTRIGTFNIFHIDDKESKASWSARLKRSMDVITSNNLDIVGLQEARPDQQTELMTSSFLGGQYGIFPAKTSSNSFSPNPIIYDTSRWELVGKESETFDIAYGRGETIKHGVQAKLKSAGCTANCTEVYVINTHDPATVVGGTDAKRSANSRVYVERIRELAKENKPVFLTGDFNSRYDDGPHCIISDSGVIKDTWEIFKNIKGCAKSRDEGTSIDRIYASPDVVVNKYWSAKSGKVNGNGSDVHSTIMNEIQIGGEAEGVFSANGYTFPLKTSRATILNEKPTPWCAMSAADCHHHYNASDIFAPTGTPVIATRGGRVMTAKDVSIHPSQIGTRVSIMGDDGWLYYYAHMGSRTLEVKQGQRIRAGDLIGKVGVSADAAGTDPHLHIDRLPGKQHSSRPLCSGASCMKYSFDNIQALMSELFKKVK